MSRWYVDSSAALKIALNEPESAALAKTIDDADPQLVGCWLLETEMLRAVPRNPDLTYEQVTAALEFIDLVETPRSTFREAGYLPGHHLRSLDAVHLAAAVQASVDAIVTYDHRMAESARDLGIKVLAPA
ncbi:MAG: type II toxin-antitoxin system VapC family toxin [Propionibacteriales bacterium]|nr:type II toxin-antitoxin system VapC family toxin [Propionibacteriales bacterium]